MATRPTTQPFSPAEGGSPDAPWVFLPRASVTRYARFFPALYLLFGALFAGSVALAVFTRWYMVPVMVAFPLVSVFAALTYAGRMAHGRIVLDAERLRVVQGNRVKASAAWEQITRLTVRDAGDEPFYEVWLGQKALALPAAFFDDGDRLLAAVAARAGCAWEAL